MMPRSRGRGKRSGKGRVGKEAQSRSRAQKTGVLPPSAQPQQPDFTEDVECVHGSDSDVGAAVPPASRDPIPRHSDGAVGSEGVVGEVMVEKKQGEGEGEVGLASKEIYVREGGRLEKRSATSTYPVEMESDGGGGGGGGGGEVGEVGEEEPEAKRLKVDGASSSSTLPVHVISVGRHVTSPDGHVTSSGSHVTSASGLNISVGSTGVCGEEGKGEEEEEEGKGEKEEEEGKGEEEEGKGEKEEEEGKGEEEEGEGEEEEEEGKGEKEEGKGEKEEGKREKEEEGEGGGWEGIEGAGGGRGEEGGWEGVEGGRGGAVEWDGAATSMGEMTEGEKEGSEATADRTGRRPTRDPSLHVCSEQYLSWAKTH